MELGILGHVCCFCDMAIKKRCGKLGGSSKSWVNGVDR